MSRSVPVGDYVEQFDPELAHHRAWLLAVLEQLVAHEPEVLQEGGALRTLWIGDAGSQVAVASPVPVMPAFPNPLQGVPCFRQTDSAQASQRSRSCFSSSCAMLVEALRPGSLKGTNGQFRTPRHIIELMVAMTEPTPRDVMVDPACGTCGFPVAVGEYLRDHHPEILSDPELREHFNHGLFHGFDFDNTMLLIGAMNMLLHGVENPDVSYRDSLSEDGAEEQDKYTLILANPPFAGSLDYESTSGKLQRVVKTKKTERRVPPLCRREHRDPVLHQNQPWRHRPRLVL